MGNFTAQKTASDRIVLLGRIVTMTTPNVIHENGAICIKNDRLIAVVSDVEHIPDDFKSVEKVETNGTIYPGLIDMHNHLSYNFIPMWAAPKRYTNRNQWIREEPDYKISISLPAKLIGNNSDIDYPRSIARFVECRSVLGGTTTTQGLSSSLRDKKVFYKGLTRNVEAPNDPLFPQASGKTSDYKTDEIETKLVPALKKDRPFFHHLSEGTDRDARQRFLDLEYKKDVWAINNNFIAIHCTGLKSEDYKILQKAGGMVWSPLSNLLLYGSTADIVGAKKSGIRMALGTDWSPSGSKNLLGELKIARIVSDELGTVFSSEELVRMVTSTPAEILGWNGQVGTIKRGMKADLLILEGATKDPFDQLVAAMEDDILAVLIDGRPRHGRMGLLDFDAKLQERIVIGGHDYSLDLSEGNDDPLGGLSLSTATDKLRYGLANLPNFERFLPKMGVMSFDLLSREVLSMDFDLETDDDFVSLQNKLRDKPGDLRPLELTPIVAIDDPDYISILKSSRNLPDYVKAAL